MKRYSFILMIMLWSMLLPAQNDAVTFSLPGGFYAESFELTLHCSIGNHIRYTTNGSTPDAQSTLYTGPLKLDKSLYSTSNIYTIVNCIPSTFYFPDTIKRAIVIRAAVFNENETCVSPVATNSYFIHSLGCDLHGLPVLSIAVDSLSLFDYETGIFVPGIYYDSSDSTHTGNYYQRGREWERQVNMEFYEPNNIGINQLCGLRTHGGASRWFQQKGMRLYAREDYGKKRFKHKFFETTAIANFKHLNLHPFRCSNWLQTGGQDYMSQTVASNLDIDCLGVRQTVVFINGEYWGIYTLEESPDERYLEDHYEVDLEKVNIIKYWGVCQYGSNTDWWNFLNTVETSNLNLPEDSAQVYPRIDASNFTDFILFETFSANLDWPENNNMEWQAENGAPFRWFFYDGDGCFTKANFNAMEHALNQEGNSMILSHFLESPYFRDTFYDRYRQLQRTYFSDTYLTSVLEHYRQTVEGEIAAQSERFNFPTNVAKWNEHLEKARLFFADRPIHYEDEILTYISVYETQIKAITVFPNPSSGTFNIQFHANANTVVPIEIYDVMGRKVLSKDLYLSVGENSIPVQIHLPAGLYTVRIDNNSTRFIIQ